MIDYLPTIRWIAFGLSLFGIIAIFVLALFSALVRGFRFFPPPDRKSWQHTTFMVLFRFYLYSLCALTIVVLEPMSGIRALLQYTTGATLLVVGFGIAFRITFQMGWRNAFGEKRGLTTDGWFRFSRNPIYVATWIGLAGWGLIANNAFISILLALWALLYVLAPLVEEPWLEQEYGEEYLTYKNRTPRFL